MAETLRQLDRTFLGEAGPQFSGVTVEGDEPRIGGADEDRVAAEGDTTIGEIAVVAVAGDVQVCLPDLTAGVGIEGNDQPAWCRYVEFAVVIHRCGFEARIATKVIDRFAGVVSPRDFQVRDIGGRNGSSSLADCYQGRQRKQNEESHARIISQAGILLQGSWDEATDSWDGVRLAGGSSANGACRSYPRGSPIAGRTQPVDI